MALWLEIIRTLLGALMLLAIYSLYGIFRGTKVKQELDILSAAFLLYTFRGALGIHAALTGATIPFINFISVEEFFQALAYVLFAVAIIRLNKIVNILRVENKLVKILHEFLR
jgi:hypothetical protein